MAEFFRYLIPGLVAGGIYAIMASGLVLTYQTSGIFNFAHGAVAFTIAFLYYHLHVGQGWPIVPAALFSVAVFGPLLGLALDRLLLRRLAAAPVYARIVGTIGLLVALPALARWLVDTVGNTVLDLGLPRLEDLQSSPPGLGPSPSKVVWRPIEGVALNSDELTVFIAAALAALVLYMVLRHTRIGLEMRADVDRRDLGGLRGINTTLVSATAWIMTMMLAGLGGLLISPLFLLNDTIYTFVVLGSLAALVAAGLGSMPIAFGAGIALGAIQNLVAGYGDRIPIIKILAEVQGFKTAIPFILTLIGLFVLSGRRGREAGVVAEDAPQRDHRAGVPVWRRLAPWTVFVGALCFFELYVADDFWSGLVAKGLVFSLIFLSFVVVTGMGGMVSLAQAAFVTAGGFTTGWLLNHQFEYNRPLLVSGGRLNFLIAASVGALVAAIVGAIVARFVGRLGALALALATLSIAFIAEQTIFQFESVKNGQFGWTIGRPSFFSFDLDDTRTFAMVTLVAFGVITVAIHNLARSANGRAMFAVRSSEVAARTSGIVPDRSRMIFFALSAAIAGFGGAMLGAYNLSYSTDTTPVLVGLVWLAVTVTFGVRRPGGALLAGLAFALTTDLVDWAFGADFMPSILTDLTTSAQLPAILFGLGAIGLAKNPDGMLALVGGRRAEGRREREHADHIARAEAEIHLGDAGVGEQVVAAARSLVGVVSGEGSRPVATTRAGDGRAAALELDGVVAGYGEVEVLHGVTVTVAPGSVVALLGANGAGKSTLCGVAAGLLAPSSGRVLRDGVDVTALAAFRRARGGLQLAPEARGIFPGLSVEENLLVTLRSAGERERAYERFPILGRRREQVAGLLSGGEQQMLALASALAAPPAVFVADEPSLGLAPLMTEEVFSALAELRDRGSALLLVEERAREALALADTVAFMELGRVVWTGPRSEVDAERLTSAYLGAAPAT